MELVRCISERKSMPGQITVGKLYWIDELSKWKDRDGDEYAQVYLDEEKKNRVGDLMTSHFKTVYRYLNFGGSLGTYVNSDYGFLLKDIISWCLSNPGNQLAEKVLLYIHDEKLDTEENMEKEYFVQSVPYKTFVDKGREEEYTKYLGYSLILAS